MGQKSRNRPKYLHVKLLAIRKHLDLSQTELAEQIGLTTGAARISEFEHNSREPCMITVLRYARLARIQMETLVDDDLPLVIPERKRRR